MVTFTYIGDMLFKSEELCYLFTQVRHVCQHKTSVVVYRSEHYLIEKKVLTDIFNCRFMNYKLQTWLKYIQGVSVNLHAARELRLEKDTELISLGS